MHVTFLMLAHEHPALCARVARHVLAAGDRLVVHLDAKAPATFRAEFEAALGTAADGVSWAQREAVEWGGWSMVRATLNGLETIEREGLETDYVYLLSGADYPIRPLAQLHEFLADHRGQEFIEHQHADRALWVQRGPQNARFRYRHWFNWRRHPHLFSWSLKTQRLLGLERDFPDGMTPHFGSQWWVLSWETCRRVLELSRRPGIEAFFRRTWVPDELFFQSAVASLVDAERVQDRHLTHYLFAEYGAPVVFHDDHLDYLAAQPFFFARKLSPRAGALRDGLDRRMADPATPPPDPDRVGWESYDYLAFQHRHRHGLTGRRSWGAPGAGCLGALERNDRPYYVLAGADEGLLARVCEDLGNHPEHRCHGRLFRSDAVEFANGAQRRAGFGRKDTAIRDQDRLDFLAELIRADADRRVGFAWRTGDSERAPAPDGLGVGRAPNLLSVLARDPNCHVIHIAEGKEDVARRGLVEAYRPQEGDRRVRCTWTRLDPADADADACRRALDAARADQPSDHTHRPRRLYLHIGVPGTGETTLQSSLLDQREVLQANGIRWAFGADRHRWIARTLAAGADPALDMIRRISADGREAPGDDVLISSAALARLPRLRHLLPLLDEWEVRVLVVLRRQDRVYEQRLGDTEGPLSATRALKDRRACAWLDYGTLLARWSDVFGHANVTAVPYPGAPERLLPAFAAWCALPGRLLKAHTTPQPAPAGPGFTPEERRRILAAYEGSNAWVADTWFGRPGESPFDPADD